MSLEHIHPTSLRQWNKKRSNASCLHFKLPPDELFRDELWHSSNKLKAEIGVLHFRHRCSILVEPKTILQQQQFSIKKKHKNKIAFKHKNCLLKIICTWNRQDCCPFLLALVNMFYFLFVHWQTPVGYCENTLRSVWSTICKPFRSEPKMNPAKTSTIKHSLLLVVVFVEVIPVKSLFCIAWEWPMESLHLLEHVKATQQTHKKHAAPPSIWRHTASTSTFFVVFYPRVMEPPYDSHLFYLGRQNGQ